IQYMWRINDRDMVQAYYMMQRIIAPPTGSGLQAHPELAAKWNTAGVGGGWATTGAPIEDATLGNLLACDLAAPPDAQCNTTPGGSPVCNSTCPCPTGEGACTSDADCGPGDVCGTNNGTFFAQPRSDRICWPSTCAQQALQECGTPTSPCGSNCAA